MIRALLLFAAALQPQSLDAPVRCAKAPCPTPDGSRVLFGFAGSIWSSPSAGGDAVRLTANSGYDSTPRVSPDGRQVVFESSRTGVRQLYLMSIRGGEPKQLTFHSGGAQLGSWSNDGRRITFSARRDGRAENIYVLDTVSGSSRKIVNDENSTTSPRFSPDGRWIVFHRGATDIDRKGYRGSGNFDIWAVSSEGGSIRRLTDFNGNDTWPWISADGRWLYFVSDRMGEAAVFRQRFDPSHPAPSKAERVSKPLPDAVIRPCVRWDGKVVAFECGNRLYQMSLDDGSPRELLAVCPAESRAPRISRNIFTDGIADFDLSKDGRRIAFSVHGELFTSLTDSDGDARRITDTVVREEEAAWSPDGTRLAYIGAADGGRHLYAVHLADRKTVRLTFSAEPDAQPRWSPDGKRLCVVRGGFASKSLVVVENLEAPIERVVDKGEWITDATWSPDSRWLAYVKEDAYLTEDIWLARVGEGEPANITRCPGANNRPQWSTDGSHIYFRSDRTRNREREKYFETGRFALYSLPLTPPKDRITAAEREEDPSAPPDEPAKAGDVRVELKDIEKRARQLTSFDEGIREFSIAPDGRTIVFGIQTLGRFEIWTSTADGGSLTRLAQGLPGASGFRWSPDGSRVLFLSGGQVRRLTKAGAMDTVPIRAVMEIDRVMERRTAFEEAWRVLADTFYDPNFHGRSWKEIGDRYRPLVDWCDAREDFLALLNQMFGELNASHLGATDSRPRGPGAPQTGYLGVRWDDRTPTDFPRILDVVADSPADREGSRLKPGEYVVAVGDRAAPNTEILYELLNGTIGRRTAVWVNDKPLREGARRVWLRPISQSAFSDLLYEEWVAQRREMVDRLSGGKAAYLHVRGMNDEARFRFERELFSLTLGKKALVLDVRFNGGGNTHDALLRILDRRRPYFLMKPRGGNPFNQPERAFTLPITLLVNERSYSDAEIFPNGFRALGLGKIVGVPTNGYVIFTNAAQLIDGTSIRRPHTACLTLDGKNLENYGVPPDIVVVNSPDDTAAGRDPQLERATAEALAAGGRK
jgi:tricorn protease